MMNFLRKKLNSKRGASMILVLTLFLVCVMVSSVILAAASAGVSRNAQRVEQQSGYLAISSASNLIIEELETLGVYAGKNVSGRYGCKDCTVAGFIYFDNARVDGYRLDADYISNPLDIGYKSNPLDDGHLIIPDDHTHSKYPYVEKDEDNTTLDGIFKGAFERGCTQVFMLNDEYSEKIRISLEEEDDRLPDVICTFIMDEKYNVKFLLTTENTDYAISITCIPDIKVSDIVESVDTTDLHWIYYKSFDDTIGIYTPKKEQWAIPVEVTSTTTEISWGRPTVMKEVLAPND